MFLDLLFDGAVNMTLIDIPIAILLCFLLLVGCSANFEIMDPESNQEVTALVSRVTDGDSISISRGIRLTVDGKVKNITEIRYIGVDTPEYDEPFYRAARALNKSLVYGKRVRLEFDKERIERYGRLLAYVYVGDTFVNAEMVRRGYARIARMEPNIKHAELFRQLEREAREQKRGMWSLSEMVQDVEPTGDREEEATKPESEHRYVASKDSDVFHLSSCQWAKRIAEANRIYFQTLQEAADSGRRPCRVCKPEATEKDSE